MLTKQCKICEQIKDIKFFHNGIICGICRHAYDTIDKKYMEMKSSALRRKKDWLITLEEFSKIPLFCHYTGVALTFKRKCRNTISIDRLDSSKGYISGNVVFCCADINRMKQEFKVSYFFELCKDIVVYNKL